MRKRYINLVSILLVETILLLLFTASDFTRSFRVISAANYSELGGLGSSERCSGRKSKIQL